MTTAVCDLFLAPKGIPSGGGQGRSSANFEMSGRLSDGEGVFLVGWLESPADFSGTFIAGGLAPMGGLIPGVRSKGRNEGIVPSHTTKLPFGSVS